MPSYKQLGVKTNRTSFLWDNRSGHHNTELRTQKHIIGQHKELKRCVTRTLHQQSGGKQVLAKSKQYYTSITSLWGHYYYGYGGSYQYFVRNASLAINAHYIMNKLFWITISELEFLLRNQTQDAYFNYVSYKKRRSPRYSEITLNLDNNVTFSPQSHFRLCDYLFYTFRLLVTLCTVDSMISW